MSRSEVLERFAPERSNLLLILHELQSASHQNHLSHDDLRAVAEYLNTTYSSVYGVATYYSMYSVAPRGRHIIRVCKSPVCDMVGASKVTGWLRRLLGIGVGETTSDGLFTLEQSACLGRCDTAPSMMVDQETFGELDEPGLSRIIAGFRDG